MTPAQPAHAIATDCSPRADPPGLLAFRVVQVCTLAPLVALAVAYVAHGPFRELLHRGVGHLASGDRAGLVAWARELGPWGPLGTALLMVVQALAFPIPAVLVTATNSLLFGWVLGGVYSIVTATLAAMICYALARTFGEPLVLRLIPQHQLEHAQTAIRQHGTTAILVARLLPFVPFDPISYVAGLARVPAGAFFVATLLGQTPAGMTYSYLAHHADQPNALLIQGPPAFLGLVVVGVALRRLLLRTTASADS